MDFFPDKPTYFDAPYHQRTDKYQDNRYEQLGCNISFLD